MARFTVTLTPVAMGELDDIYVSLAGFSDWPPTLKRVRRAFQKKLEYLEDFADSGTRSELDVSIFRTHVGRYTLYYRIKGRNADVVHTAASALPEEIVFRKS